MTERFEIEYCGAVPAAHRLARILNFRVTAEGQPDTYIAVIGPLHPDPKWLLAPALARLESELRTRGSGVLSTLDEAGDRSGEIRIFDDVERAEEAERAGEPSWKGCVWQSRGERDWTCLAHVGDGTMATTPGLCGSCSISDERVVCAHLMKPGIAHKTTQFARARVMVMQPGCMIGQQPGAGDECRVGGKECWRRIVEAHVSIAEDPPPDLPRSVADELDFLRLVTRDRLGILNSVPVPQARSVSELFGVCGSAEDLQRRLAAIGDVLNRLDFAGALDENDQVDNEGNKLKSLAALERLLEQKAPEAAGAGGPVATLRAIVRVRNSFPIHTLDGETRANFRRLEIDYPPPDGDWESAWRKILVALWSAVRRIREALQTMS